MPIQDVDLNTYQERCTIENSGRRGLERSTLEVRHEDDDNMLVKKVTFKTDVILLPVFLFIQLSDTYSVYNTYVTLHIKRA